jgi:hypothetical protein
VTLGDTAVTEARLADIPELGLHVSSDPDDLFYPTPMGIAVTKDQTELEQALMEAVQILEDNGELEALREEYALAAPDPKQVDQAIAESEG